jgi:Mce-associated membrane protein
MTTENDPVDPDAPVPDSGEPTTTAPEGAEPEAEEPEDAAIAEADETDAVEPEAASGIRWSRVFAFGVLPALALVLAVAAGVLKWHDSEVRQTDAARAESLQAARNTVTVMLTYEPAKIDEQLSQARDLLTGPFRETYTRMTNEIVIPGAKQQGITAVAAVPGAAIESVDKNHAVTMLYVNQKVSVGGQMPTDNLSTVKVTLDKVGDRWLVSQFEPV